MTDGTAASAGTALRGPGRPRKPEHDERVLDAVVALIDAGLPITVSAVVERSGVSRAAIYRRWPRMTDLVAAALDRGRAPVSLDLSGDIREAILVGIFGDHRAARGNDYPDRRFRARMQLTTGNPELQRAYWTSHVRRRRTVMIAALAEAVRRGELRDDLDLEACLDLINGVFYYQIVVRGVWTDEPGAMDRCRNAFDVAWRGMSAR